MRTRRFIIILPIYPAIVSPRCPIDPVRVADSFNNHICALFVRLPEIVYREAMSKTHPAPRPVLLCILDGWGERAESKDNAIALAKTPVWSRLKATQPHALLETSGLAVGLPEGQMGNSEVGHMNLGAGRVVMQDLPRIDLAIKDGSVAKDKQ